MSLIGSFLVAIAVIGVSLADTLKPRCGDCWCIPYGEFNECPNSTGISDTFPESFSVYDTFELVNANASYLQLRTPEGNECYPFADTLGELNGYPKSSLPQCAIPEQTFDTVCAYKFENGVECSGRKYEILTYDSAQAAQEDGAVVTHTGACGVCSNAKDLWTRMRTIDDFETEQLVCVTLYVLQPDSEEQKFESLVQCAIKAGLSPECALLYAHVGAATITDCKDACETNALTGSTETNGPPPTCALTPCFECPLYWNMFFDEIAGRTMERSGITENTAKRCSIFSPMEHDPCVGALDTADQVGIASSVKSSASALPIQATIIISAVISIVTSLHLGMYRMK